MRINQMLSTTKITWVFKFQDANGSEKKKLKGISETH